MKMKECHGTIPYLSAYNIHTELFKVLNQYFERRLKEFTTATVHSS